jgi:hypothetical protein
VSTMSVGDVTSALIGAWKLISWQEVRPDGTIDYPLGAHATGQLMYEASGRMSAQLARPGQAHFASDDWRQAKPKTWPQHGPTTSAISGLSVSTTKPEPSSTTSRADGSRTWRVANRFAVTAWWTTAFT